MMGIVMDPCTVTIGWHINTLVYCFVRSFLFPRDWWLENPIVYEFKGEKI